MRSTVTRKLLITGAAGQLGRDLALSLAEEYDLTAADSDELDITAASDVAGFVKRVRPAIVLNTAAYTDVDGCESNESRAQAVNADGAENVATACRDVGALMVHYSTDYVFDGEKESAYVEADRPNPQTVYGLSKLAGERRVMAALDKHVILRIGWVYGRYGSNFIGSMLRLARKWQEARRSGQAAEPLKVVDDQVGSPTWTMDIARQTKAVLQSDLTGLFHCSSEGEVSRYGFACEIFDRLAWEVEVKPCDSGQYPRPAKRPRRSALENSRLKEAGLNLMRDYREALDEYLKHNREILTGAV